MRVLLSIGQVFRQIVLLISYSILHIGMIITKYICVETGLGNRIGWFLYRYRVQGYFKLNLCAYWVMCFVGRLLYGRNTDING